MSDISRISSVNGGSPITSIGSSTHAGQPTHINFHERFNFPEIKLEKRSQSQIRPEERLNYAVMLGLFLEILQSGVDIVPQLAKDHGKYIVEASFVPSINKNRNHRILVPLRGVSEPLVAPPLLAMNNNLRYKVEDYVLRIIDHSTDEDIMRLVVVMSHEFGHYISFSKGFHDKQLQYGSYLAQSKQVGGKNDVYTWLVFREEVTAWRYGYDVLHRYEFEFFPAFSQVKFDSLRTYYTNLKLKDASLAVYFKLSALGDDFIEAARQL